MIVGVEPGGECFASLGVGAVRAGVGPFVGQGAVKSLYLAVGLGPIWASAAMLDVAKGVGEGVRAVAGAVEFLRDVKPPRSV